MYRLAGMATLATMRARGYYRASGAAVAPAVSCPVPYPPKPPTPKRSAALPAPGGSGGGVAGAAPHLGIFLTR